MKKLLVTLAILVTFSLFGKSHVDPKIIDEEISNLILLGFEELGYKVLPEVIIQDTLKKTKYQKYWEEKELKEGRGPMVKTDEEFDDVYYIPPKDTLKKHKKSVKKQSTQVVEINYYNDIPFTYGRFFHPFYFSWNFYSPFYYDFYSPFYYDWYYPYYGWGIPYYSYYPWRHYPIHYHNSYYTHRNYMTYTYNTNRGRSSNIVNTSPPRRISQTYTNKERSSNIVNTNPPRRISQTHMESSQRTTTINRNLNNERRYVPTYNNTRTSVRPQYNNSRPSQSEYIRSEMTNPSRGYSNSPNRSPELNNYRSSGRTNNSGGSSPTRR